MSNRYPSTQPRFTGTSWISVEKQWEEYNKYQDEQRARQAADRQQVRRAVNNEPITLKNIIVIAVMFLCCCLLVWMCWHGFHLLELACIDYMKRHPSKFTGTKKFPSRFR